MLLSRATYIPRSQFAAVNQINAINVYLLIREPVAVTTNSPIRSCPEICHQQMSLSVLGEGALNRRGRGGRAAVSLGRTADGTATLQKGRGGNQTKGGAIAPVIGFAPPPPRRRPFLRTPPRRRGSKESSISQSCVARG